MHSNKKQIVISGIISIFLVTTLAVTSALISNPNFSLDIRNYAKQINEDEGGYTNKQTVKTPAKIVKPKTSNPSDLEAEEQAYIEKANVAPAATLTPTPTPTPIPKDERDPIDVPVIQTTQAPLVNADKWTDEPSISDVTMTDSSGNTISNEAYQAALKASSAPVVTYNYIETDKTGQTTAVTSSNDHNKVQKVTTNDEGVTKTEVIIVKPTNSTDYIKTNIVTTTDEDNNIIDSQTTTTKTVTQTTPTTISGNTVETKTITTTDEAGKVIDKVVVTAATPAPVVTNSQESQSFWQQLSNKFNDASNDTGLVGIGTGGLGMDGSTTAIPQSVITSNDPEAVNNYLLGSTLAVAAGAGAAAATVAAPVVYSAGPAIAAYSSAAISTTVAALPAAVQTGLAVAGTTAAIAAPYLGMNQCIQSGDPGSPACVGMVTGYMSNPLEAEYALSDSYNAVKNIIPPVENVFSSPALDPIMAEIQTEGGQKMLDHYIKNNKGPIPEQIFVHKADKDFYSFQTKLIEAAKDNTVDSKLLAETMRELEATGNVRFVIESADEIKALCGGNAYCQNKYYPEIGRKLPTVHMPLPSDFAETNGKSLAQAETELGGILGHEVGHAWDNEILPIYGIDPNSNGGLWASELMQYEFSIQYKAAQGLRNKVLEDFVGHIYSSAEIIKAQVK